MRGAVVEEGALTQHARGSAHNADKGRDTTLDGAQARGQTILADVGRNLTLTSTQDSNQYTEKDQSASAGLSLCIPPFCYGTSSGGASYHQTDIGNNYRSVTDQTGLAAGRGGFQIHVGGTTSLTGAALASTADASKNLLDTGNLVFADLSNQADYEASQFGANYNSSGSLGSDLTQNTLGGALSLGIPQSGNHSSTTHSGITQGTITIRNHPGQNLTGLDRDVTSLDGHGVADTFDLDKIKENQQLGQAAGYVGMRTVGMIAEHEQKQAAGELAAAEANHDTAAKAAAEAKLKRWGESGTDKVLLHGLVGAATAALGGGNAVEGALGAGASEAASLKMEQYLVAHGVQPDSPEGKTLMGLASTAIGGAVGQGAGAATALQGEKYSRQLHPTEIAWIQAHVKAFAKQQCGGCANPDVKQATERLTQQALKDVDFWWARTLSPTTDQAAQQYLASAKGTFRNQAGLQQGLFTVQGNQDLEWDMYMSSSPATQQFYQAYAQPGVTRTPGEGFAQWSKKMGSSLATAYASDPERFVGRLAVGTVEGIGQSLWNGLHHPARSLYGALGVSSYHAVSGGLQMTGFADGFNDPNARAPSMGIALANAYYGQNMYWALSTTSLANVGLTALTVTGAGKGASSALEAGGKVAANDAVKDLTQKASDSLVAGGGKVAKGAGTALDSARSLKGGFTDSLANAWSGSKSGMQQFARSLAGEDGTIHGFVSADKLNALMESLPDWSAAWQQGTAVANMTLAKGTKVFMVVDQKAYKAIANGRFDRAFGGWATFDNVPSRAYARDKLALTPAMKENACCVVELELTQSVNSYVGIVKRQTYKDADGVEHIYPGGGNQIHFNLPRDDRSKVFKVIAKRMFK